MDIFTLYQILDGLLLLFIYLFIYLAICILNMSFYCFLASIYSSEKLTFGLIVASPKVMWKIFFYIWFTVILPRCSQMWLAMQFSYLEFRVPLVTFIRGNMKYCFCLIFPLFLSVTLITCMLVLFTMPLNTLIIFVGFQCLLRSMPHSIYCLSSGSVIYC